MVLELLKELKRALVVFLILTVLTGIIYPLIVTGIAQLLFVWRANGSFIYKENQIIGSELIGQSFTDPKYFWGRPSATEPFPYNSALSAGSNLGPLNPKFLLAVKGRIALLKEADPDSLNEIPVDLVTSSGSGLDPHICPAAAFYQAARIAKVRNIPKHFIRDLINKTIERRTFHLLGEPRVNVLRLNLALDALDHQIHPKSQP